MSVFEKSFFYQEIVQQAREKAIREEGLLSIIREERLLSIELLLEIKFGIQGLELMPEISQIFDLE
ncbi:hypothetical protein [Nostoc sp.]|uniref:hypothetical protein n=1 Tax=Nostoc sp. TaxID=1180 RepID=UPI002FF5A2F8